MKNKLIAAVTVIALGALAVTAFASDDTGAGTTTTQPAAATPANTASPHVRREDRREDRRADRREDRPATSAGAEDRSGASGRDQAEDDGVTTADEHGGRGRDHAEDDGTVEVHEAEPGDDRGGRGEVEAGDDRGGHGETEAGDDRGGHGETEAGDDRGGHGGHSGHGGGDDD